MKYRELIAKLKKFGVAEMDLKRGKGSERILLRPVEPGSKKGLRSPIKHHGQGTIIYTEVIKAILRRLGISEDDFWN